MATAAEIADLITAGVMGPQGADDSGWHLGQILTWDASTGLNSVRVNNAVLTNLKALTPSLGTEYTPGQSVLIVRKQTQYFILGPVQVPGALGSTPPTQIDGVGGTLSGTANVWRDLDAGASVSPTVSVKLSSYQRCLFMWGANYVRCWGSTVSASLVVTSPGGLNQMATPAYFNGMTVECGNQISVSNYMEAPLFKTYLVQVSRPNSVPGNNALVSGINVASIKYKLFVNGGAAGAGTATASVGTPWILAIPF
jgi:hypothetical protein